jgi:TolB-like protein
MSPRSRGSSLRARAERGRRGPRFRRLAPILVILAACSACDGDRPGEGAADADEVPGGLVDAADDRSGSNVRSSSGPGAWSAAAVVPAASAVPAAVVYFENTSQDPALDVLRKGFAEMLVTDLSVSGELALVERTRLDSVLDELELQETSFVDPATVSRLGRGLGARLLVTGSYLVQGDTLRVDARVIEVESARIVLAVRAEGSRDDFLVVERDLVERLLEGLGSSLSVLQRQRLAQGVTRDFDAFTDWSSAMEQLDAGDGEAAQTALRAALRKDPGFARAQEDLATLTARVSAAVASREDRLLTAPARIVAAMELNAQGADLRVCEAASQELNALTGAAIHGRAMDSYSPELSGLYEVWRASLGIPETEDEACDLHGQAAISFAQVIHGQVSIASQQAAKADGHPWDRIPPIVDWEGEVMAPGPELPMLFVRALEPRVNSPRLWSAPASFVSVMEDVLEIERDHPR